MCGIFALLNSRYNQGAIYPYFKKGCRRGPEFSTIGEEGMKVIMGFHRLAINGLNSESNQPIRIGDIVLICNGEIYNYKELYELLGDTVNPTTASDCEIIVHLYMQYGMEHTLSVLDGEFAFVLLDQSAHLPHSLVYIARDPFGVRPLYISNVGSGVGFASEMKMLAGHAPEGGALEGCVSHFAPGYVSTYELSTGIHPTWTLASNVPFFLPRPVSVFSHADPRLAIFTKLENAVRKRVNNTERPVACLLSGGLDSSLIASISASMVQVPIETYSIGLSGSEDLAYARKVADHIGSKHTEIVLSENDFLTAIPEVIEAIESYDTTTVRASIGNYLLGKYIAANSDCKVILNGDGADEVAGGYLYMHACPNALEFDRETRRLLREIHKYDVLRSDKSIASHGLEPRTPFLDRDFVDTYLSIPPEQRFHPGKGTQEKYLLREAFSGKRVPDGSRTYLPDEVLWRRKEAFSDGVSKTTRSLYEIIQEHVETLEGGKVNVSNVPPITREQHYYRSIFERLYEGQGNIISHFWMPKYVDATDASARTIVDQITCLRR
jgi:asparagine synthase (glutamine-hydrolysing)